jgi:hypothetical protein
MLVELRDVTSENELRDRYRSVRTRLMSAPKQSVVAAPGLKSQPSPGNQKRKFRKFRLEFEPKAIQVLSLIPRRREPGVIHQVMVITADIYGITVADLKGRSRLHVFSHPRSLAMAICADVFGYSGPHVGWQFGGRDHTTVIQALRKYGALIRTILSLFPRRAGH